MQNEDIGIRERKRRETKRRICQEAARLAEAHGYDNVTVEDICEASGISRRTFFNYVDSKDEAVLGVFPFALSEQALEEIRRTPTENLLDLILRSLELAPGAEQLPDPASRRDLLENNPSLLHAEAVRRRGFLTRLGRAVLQHLEDIPEDRRFAGPAEAETHFIVGLFQLAVNRYLWHPPAGHDSIEQLRKHAQELTDYTKDMKW